MANRSANSVIYEVKRLAMRLAGFQLPDRDFTKRKISGLKLSDLQVAAIQTSAVSIQEAAIQTLRLLEEYKTEIDEDVRFVRELLQLNPYFSHIQWVSDAAERLEKCQRARRKRRRPKWRYTLNPEVVVGLVQVLRASGEATSDRDAAKWLEISKMMSSTKVLRKIKQAKKDPRLSPMLSSPPDSWPVYTDEELTRMDEAAITLEEGQTLQFELQGDHFQYVGTQFPVEQPCADENNS